ncbi:DNase1 protein [Diaporthe helianthi]|uniref:DNase1 protein n=1 Tax=Diaporthe helianthi TaxID=158607 RepID=A0A2P5HPT8_DIAHE|nr:DNase1 protein [Diaporthe helianthi]
MQHITLALLASASLAAAANQITFLSMDDTDRTVHFTPNAGLAWLEPTDVPAGQNVTVTIPDYWIGNYYSISSGADNIPGMLGEVNFNSWGGLTYFDVSAIVDENDHNGVYMMYPIDSEHPVSGCTSFLCDTLYRLPDDIQTKATKSTHLVTTLGAGNQVVYKTALATRDLEQRVYPRAAVTDRNWTPARLHSRQFRV